MPVKRTKAKPAKTPSARKPSARKQSARGPEPAHDHVAVRAYYLHLEGGHDPFENWIRAERELVGA